MPHSKMRLSFSEVEEVPSAFCGTSFRRGRFKYLPVKDRRLARSSVTAFVTAHAALRTSFCLPRPRMRANFFALMWASHALQRIAEPASAELGHVFCCCAIFKV